MKKILFLSSIAVVLLVASCRHENKNNCYNQYCDNGGYCQNGACSCPPGFSGPHCDSVVPDTATLLTFWMMNNCNCGPISVTCNNQTVKMTEYFPNNPPTCGTRGCANFTLPAGTYTYTATCDDTSWSGTVTVSHGVCNLKQLYCDTGNVTFWVDTAGNAVTVSVGGQTQTITAAFTSSTPNCGAAGCANFTLPTGTYAYTATSATVSDTGTVNVTNNGCTLRKLY